VSGDVSGGGAATVPLTWDTETFGYVRLLPHLGEEIDQGSIRVVEALASQAALTISHALLSSRMVTARESERRKIERDIHDGVQQDLATQIGQIALARNSSSGGEDLDARLARIQEEMQRTLAGIRDLAQGIYPSVLRDGGLLAAVEDRCDRLPFAVTIEARQGIRGARFEDDVETAAYFTVTEALANAVKHARASRVSIGLSLAGGELLVEVSDDGVGYNPTYVVAGTGLSGLADRLRALGGTLDVDSQLGVGTTVRAKLLVERAKETP
jgi:signal transduction histidine kinase